MTTEAEVEGRRSGSKLGRRTSDTDESSGSKGEGLVEWVENRRLEAAVRLFGSEGSLDLEDGNGCSIEVKTL